MPDDDRQPAAPMIAPVDNLQDVMSSLPATLRIMLDPQLFDRIRHLARIMAGADGYVPRHLIGKSEACFAVITRSIGWRLDPYFVAMNTYQTPGGSIGFQGKLCQAILEQSGRFIGGIVFEHVGDWTVLTGRFETKTSAKGHEFPSPTWKRTDPEVKDLGIIVRGHVRGEKTARVWPGENKPFMLSQCHPLNSPLWATDPRTQICYLAVRRFGDLAAPGIYGGVPFSVDDFLEASEMARDVTPPQTATPAAQPPVATSSVQTLATAASVATPAPPAAEHPGDEEPPWEVTDNDGRVHQFKAPLRAAQAIDEVFREAAKRGTRALDAAWENNKDTVSEMTDSQDNSILQDGEDLIGLYNELTAAAIKAADTAAEAEAAAVEAAAAAAAEEAAKAAEAAEAAKEAPAAPSAPTVDPWWNQDSFAIDPPKSRTGRGYHWIPYAEHMTNVSRGAPSLAKLAKLQTDNRRHIDSLKLYHRPGWEVFVDAVATRERELEGK